MFKSSIKLFVTIFFIFLSVSFAQSETQCFVDDHNVVIKGYDPVSYFTENKAVKGKEKYSATFGNATFHFANAKNKELFEKNPMKYMPQYGGYCAFGMGAKNMKVPSNPETFEIVDGKLFLFFNDVYKGKKMNTKMMWDKDPKKIHQMADANWEKLTKKEN